MAITTPQTEKGKKKQVFIHASIQRKAKGKKKTYPVVCRPRSRHPWNEKGEFSSIQGA